MTSVCVINEFSITHPWTQPALDGSTTATVYAWRLVGGCRVCLNGEGGWNLPLCKELQASSILLNDRSFFPPPTMDAFMSNPSSWSLTR